jgi:hypothetical protein
MKIMTASAFALGTLTLAACQPTPAAQTIAMSDNLTATELQELDTNNDGVIDAAEAQRIESVANRGVSSVPESQLVTVDD